MNTATRIVQNGDPVLREMAQPIAIKDITSKRIQDVISNMKTALSREKDGVAIAAPQIGVPLRIFIISGAVLKQADEKYTGSEDYMIFINPRITKLSRSKKVLEEGCLSVRWLYGKVKRADKASIQAHNERGESFERGASGLLAQVFQHETDHLDGILFIDTAKDLENIPPEEQNANE